LILHILRKRTRKAGPAKKRPVILFLTRKSGKYKIWKWQYYCICNF